MNQSIFNQFLRLKNIADLGMLYATNEYDRERYAELNAISLELLGKISGYTNEELQICFPLVKDYPTPKVDVRGILLSPDKKILLVKEATDGRWSLPGGWADIGFTPKEVIIKECKEETGLEVEVKSLLAVFDKRMHAHPPQAAYVYKMLFYCEALSADFNTGFDIEHAAYFALDELPELSVDRILESQIRLVYDKIEKGDFTCWSD